MAGMCAVTVVGNLGADPEVKFGENGQAMAKLRLAVTEKRKKDGAWTEQTQWFGVSVFGKSAEHCGQYLQKGRQVLVMGRLEAREYQAKDGTMKTALEVVADKVQFLGARDDGAGAGSGGGAAPAEEARPQAAAPSSSRQPQQAQRPGGKAAPSRTPARDPDDLDDVPF